MRSIQSILQILQSYCTDLSQKFRVKGRSCCCNIKTKIFILHSTCYLNKLTIDSFSFITFLSADLRNSPIVANLLNPPSFILFCLSTGAFPAALNCIVTFSSSFTSPKYT